jgi:hypothetical protein
VVANKDFLAFHRSKQILKRRWNRKTNRFEYFVKWLNFGDEYNEWCTLEDLHCPDLLAKFKAGHRKGAEKTQCTINDVLFYDDDDDDEKTDSSDDDEYYVSKMKKRRRSQRHLF